MSEMKKKKLGDIEAKKKRHLGAVTEHVVEFVKAQVSWRLCSLSETQSLPLPQPRYRNTDIFIKRSPIFSCIHLSF